VAEFVQDPQTGLDKLSRSYAWDQDVGGGIGGLLSITTYQADGATPDKTYLPLYDGGGNVMGLVDTALGTVVATYEYDPFGNTLSATGDAAALAAKFVPVQHEVLRRRDGAVLLRHAVLLAAARAVDDAGPDAGGVLPHPREKEERLGARQAVTDSGSSALWETFWTSSLSSRASMSFRIF
jgi:hypothetical protein